MSVPTSESDYHWLSQTIELSRKCPPAAGAFNVGAVIVGRDGGVISEGYSREGGDPHVHAEEAALAKLAPDDPRLAEATLYSSLEPCSERRSRPHPCAQLIVRSGIPRVVIAWREPDLFVADCQGVEMLTGAGIEVVELNELAEAARAVNADLGL